MKRLNISTLLIIVISIFSFVEAAESSTPIIVENGKKYYVYTVQKSEGVFAVSQRFGVSQNDIIAINPECADGLQLGQKIKIPVTVDNVKIVNEYQSNLESVKNTGVKASDSGKVHKVKAKETLYSISNKYGVTVDDILELNPWAYALSAGSILRIPNQRAITHENSNQEISPIEIDNNNIVNDIRETTNNIIEETEPVIKLPKAPKKSVRIAILMPFVIDSINRDANLDHFTDFYKGCLLAADSLIKSGLNVTIDAYDIGKSATKLTTTLNMPQLKQADIIIGPAYSSQITYVAAFAKKNNIKLIVPFTSNIAGIEDNPNIFQIITPQKELFDIATDSFAKLFIGKEILIVRPDTLGLAYNKKEFVTQLLPKLTLNGIDYKMINEKDIQNTVNNLAAKNQEKEYVVILPTTKKTKLIQLSESVSQFTESNISLLGFQEWDTEQIRELYTVPMYIFTNYNILVKSPEIKDLYNKYITKFGVPYHQTKPSFTIVGFDVFHYFATQLQNNGINFEQYLEDEDKLQMKFSFRKLPNGGYQNKGIYIYEYRDQSIRLIEQ